MIGVEKRSDGKLCIVSKWMANGSLSRYLAKHADDAGLNRLQLVSQDIMRSVSLLNMTWVSFWTFARACGTYTHKELLTVISKVYVCHARSLVTSNPEYLCSSAG